MCDWWFCCALLAQATSYVNTSKWLCRTKPTTNNSLPCLRWTFDSEGTTSRAEIDALPQNSFWCLTLSSQKTKTIKTNKLDAHTLCVLRVTARSQTFLCSAEIWKVFCVEYYYTIHFCFPNDPKCILLLFYTLSFLLYTPFIWDNKPIIIDENTISGSTYSLVLEFKIRLSWNCRFSNFPLSTHSLPWQLNKCHLLMKTRWHG